MAVGCRDLVVAGAEIFVRIDRNHVDADLIVQVRSGGASGLPHVAHDLAAGHVLVLQPERDEILMANPFSAVPTAFAGETDAHSYWGNCVWDALGILAMLGRDGRLLTSCADCGDALALEVRGGALGGDAGVAHFSIPAKHWWDDIAFT